MSSTNFRSILLLIPSAGYYLRTSSFSFSLPGRYSDPGSRKKALLLPPPHSGGARLHFYREKSSAHSTLLVARRIVRFFKTRSQHADTAVHPALYCCTLFLLFGWCCTLLVFLVSIHIGIAPRDIREELAAIESDPHEHGCALSGRDGVFFLCPKCSESRGSF